MAFKMKKFSGFGKGSSFKHKVKMEGRIVEDGDGMGGDMSGNVVNEELGVGDQQAAEQERQMNQEDGSIDSTPLSGFRSSWQEKIEKFRERLEEQGMSTSWMGGDLFQSRK